MKDHIQQITVHNQRQENDADIALQERFFSRKCIVDDKDNSKAQAGIKNRIYTDVKYILKGEFEHHNMRSFFV